MTREYRSKQRDEAKRIRFMAESRGEIKYLGTPCKHGHSGFRYTRNGLCVECSYKNPSLNRVKLKQELLDSLNEKRYKLEIRIDAITQGLKRYISDACNHCGGTERYVISNDCPSCKKMINNRVKLR